MLKYCISDFFLLCLTMQKWLHFIAVVECPATHPFAYQNGSYCCQTNQEKINTAQGVYHWDSIWTAYCSVLCEAHKHVLWACSIMCLFIAVLCTYIWIEKIPVLLQGLTFYYKFSVLIVCEAFAIIVLPVNPWLLLSYLSFT